MLKWAHKQHINFVCEVTSQKDSWNLEKINSKKYLM
jgi:hypothetical protein